MKMMAKQFVTIAAFLVCVVVFGLTDANAQAQRDGDPSVLEVIMPLSDSDQVPDYDNPAVTSGVLSDPNHPMVQADNDDPLIAVLDTIEPPLPTGPDGELSDFFLAAADDGQDLPFRPMMPNTRPGESQLLPITGADGTRGTIMSEFSPDGSVFIPEDFTETVQRGAPADPFTVLTPEGDLILAAPAEDEVAAMLLVDGEIRVRNVSLGQTRTLLEIENMQLDVTDSVTLGQYGRIITHIYGSSAGLDLAEGAELDLARGSRIKLFFHDAPSTEGIHWGMRAKGNRVAEFTALARAGRITVSLVFEGAIAPSAAVIKFDGEYTYITVDKPKHDRPVRSEVNFSREEVPEPMTLALLAIGSGALLRRKRS